MAAVKVLIAGGEGSGKRELVESISDVITDSSPTGASRYDRVRRSRTHHALEFGQIEIDSTVVVHLYVLPADRQSDFMWQILGQDAVGFVVLVAADNLTDMDDARHMLSVLARMPIPFAVGVNGAAPGDHGAVSRVRDGLQVGEGVAVMPCDCLDRESVKALLCELFRCVARACATRSGQPAGAGTEVR